MGVRVDVNDELKLITSVVTKGSVLTKAPFVFKACHFVHLSLLKHIMPTSLERLYSDFVTRVVSSKR